MCDHPGMVRGQAITPAQKRRLVAKLRALRTAEAEVDALVLELNDEGVSVQSMSDASGKQGDQTYVAHSTLHRWVQRARAAPPPEGDSLTDGRHQAQ
jgi:hypothetical protein